MIPSHIHYKHSAVNLYECDFPAAIDSISREIGGRQLVIITDSNVSELFLAGSSFENVIVIGPGESNKTLDTVIDIYSELMEMEIGRDAVLVGMGGGVVCDIAGFVGSTYKRGMKFGFIPTTLLAQADAAIGGKNGVNHNGVKNVIGLVRQPDFIIFDFNLLDTLPERELTSGFAEVIKTALIGSAELFDLLESDFVKPLSLDKNIMAGIIGSCVEIKAGITSQDETDTGKRQVLNFGHTIGHAIEAISDLSHGQAISIGMVHALELSRQHCGLTEPAIARIKKLLMKFQLPTEYKSDTNKIIGKLIHDKKINDDIVNFILLEDIGQPIIKNIQIDYLIEFLKQSTRQQ